MDSNFLKQINPDGPDSGCVNIKYEGGGDVSKRIHNRNIFFENTYQVQVSHIEMC